LQGYKVARLQVARVKGYKVAIVTLVSKMINLGLD